MANALVGTGRLAQVSGDAANSNVALAPSVQQIWSKEILFQAMPILRFEQFAVKKTELGIQPGLTVKFMRYKNLNNAEQLTEGVRMETHALTAEQYEIEVFEHGYAIAVSEMLLNASFDDVMASASRLLGRNMAIYLDQTCRDTLYAGSSVKFGYTLAGTRGSRAPYEPGTAASMFGYNGGDGLAAKANNGLFSAHLVKDGVETLASKNVPRLGETYVCFVHPYQSRQLRDDPEWIEVTKYAAPGNFMLGEIGRINDVVFIESTQVASIPVDAQGNLKYTYPGINNAGGVQGQRAINPAYDDTDFYDSAGALNGAAAGDRTAEAYEAYQGLLIGDNAFGHAISLPVELRDGGIIDFGREHALAWYAIWGLGLITDEAIVKLATKPYSSQTTQSFTYELSGGINDPDNTQPVAGDGLVVAETV